MATQDTTVAAPEMTVDDILHLSDPYFTADTVAIVTGGASGIGRATSIALASNGVTVAGVDIDTDGLAETVTIGEDLDVAGTIEPIEADLTSHEDVKTAVEQATTLGTVRFLANIAGMQHIASIEDFPIEIYDTMHDLMLRAPFLLSKYVMRAICATDEQVGAIGNMSSIHGQYATKAKPAYITLKHGITGLTRAIAAEGGGTLRGFSVSTSYVLTPLMENQIADTAVERGISEQDVVNDVMLSEGRATELMTPMEVANLFVFGFSTHASHLNGGDLLFDGGYTTTYE